MSECEARIETEEGQVYLDWSPIEPHFDIGTVVPPFKLDYQVHIRCPGYAPTTRTISSKEAAKQADLGLIVLAPPD